MYANWTRCSGLASAFAPASMSTLRPRFVGITIAIPGRCTPGSRRMCRSDAASIAPVFPAETTASASPFATARTARTSDESGFERTDFDRVVVHVDRLGRLDELETVRVEGRRAEENRLDVGRGCVGRAGDDLVGRAITTESVDGNADHARRLRRVEAERLDVPALVRLAVRADAMHPLRLLAGRADLHVRGGERVLRAALVAPRPGCLSLRDGHERLGTIAAASALSSARSARGKRRSCETTTSVPRVVDERALELLDGLEIEVVRRLVEDQQVDAARLQLGEMARVRSPGESDEHARPM